MSRALVALAAVLGLLAGCAQLPVSGPVRHEEVADAAGSEQAPYFSPPGPATDGSPSSIVSGFLTAQQANPLSTRVARQFLSERVRSSWQPNRGTIVYEAFTVLPSSGGVRVRLADARRLDARGGWRGGRPGRAEVVDLSLVSENGQWRIDNPPPVLVVPASFFERTFDRTELYFFDQTDQVLLPDPVFVPRGEQSATNLVRGLLAGPGPTLAPVSRSAFPRGTGLELSVVVTEGGVAEVPLTRELLRASPAGLRRAADQLAWTLGQVPGVQRVRMSVGDAPVPLPGGVIDVPVTRAEALDAAGPPDAALLAVRQDRLVRLRSGAARDLAGRLGEGGFSPRSLAVGDDPAQVAGVTDGGTRLLRSPLVLDDGDPVQVLTGTDLARPSYDMFGGLWVLDRTSSGARVLLVEGDRVRELDVPGVTGRDVSALSVARDGSRLAASYAGGGPEAAVVVGVTRGEEGTVSGTAGTEVLRLGAGGDVVDVGWRDPSTLALLTRPGAGTSRVDFLTVDGSPLGRATLEDAVFRGEADALVVSSSSGTPLGLLTDSGDLYQLETQGTWGRAQTQVTSATFAP
ncbi:LpqB family beta-propeller domain-containing protein [Nocardioides marmoraquaticus]